MPGFAPVRREIVQAVIAGQNTLAIMPTGGGKSLCFQLPALCREGVTVVISPLIALMRDQVRALKAAGVEAGALTSGNTEDETEDVFAALDEGRLKLLWHRTRTAGSGGHFADAAADRRQSDRGGRGALRQPMGPRLPPGLLAHWRLAAIFGRAARRLHRHRRCRNPGRDCHALVWWHPAPMTFLRGFDRPNIRLAFAVKDSPRDQIFALCGGA